MRNPPPLTISPRYTSQGYRATPPSKALPLPGSTSALPSLLAIYSPPPNASRSPEPSIQFPSNIRPAPTTSPRNSASRKRKTCCRVSSIISSGSPTPISIVDSASTSRFTAVSLPVRGDTVEQIRGALQDFLRANGISGEVNEIPYGPFGKLVGLLFHVDGISQPIKSIAFSGEAAVTDKQLLAASAGLTNQDFSVTNVASYASSALLPLVLRAGIFAFTVWPRQS